MKLFKKIFNSFNSRAESRIRSTDILISGKRFL